jgi:hypothetical protein
MFIYFPTCFGRLCTYHQEKNCIYATLGACYSVWMVCRVEFHPAYQIVIHWLPLFSVKYNAEGLETECSSIANYSWQKITNLLARISLAIFTCAQVMPFVIRMYITLYSLRRIWQHSLWKLKTSVSPMILVRNQIRSILGGETKLRSENKAKI